MQWQARTDARSDLIDLPNYSPQLNCIGLACIACCENCALRKKRKEERKERRRGPRQILMLVVRFAPMATG
jgi:hypothetical protein